MEKTIKIGEHDVRLNNNVGWTMVYRDQFGRDIIPVLMPMAASAVDIITGLIEETGKTGEITLKNIARLVDGDALINAVIHLGGIEFVDFINITWALAKCADEDIPEPNDWVKQFEVFPVDVIAPEVVGLIFKGIVSSKNLRRLEEAMKELQPEKLHSTTLSSQDSNED